MADRERKLKFELFLQHGRMENIRREHGDQSDQYLRAIHKYDELCNELFDLQHKVPV